MSAARCVLQFVGLSRGLIDAFIDHPSKLPERRLYHLSSHTIKLLRRPDGSATFFVLTCLTNSIHVSYIPSFIGLLIFTLLSYITSLYIYLIFLSLT